MTLDLSSSCCSRALASKARVGLDTFSGERHRALDRIRTCDLWYRKPALYPLSYEGKENATRSTPGIRVAFFNSRSADSKRGLEPLASALKGDALPTELQEACGC